MKANAVLDAHIKPIASISGGKDSDIMLDLLQKVDFDKKITYVWYDTGLEYQASKDHLVELEKKYNFEIKRLKPKKTIPMCTKEYGQPFLSKMVSDYFSRLQKKGFQCEDEDFKTLMAKYPRAQTALEWWTNENPNMGKSFYNIARNAKLKEFMVANPPDFKISNMCCEWTKKKLSHFYEKENNCDLSMMGLRKAEGGIRASIPSCYTEGKNSDIDVFRPIFWFSDDDEKYYAKLFGITHSRCYTEYGMPRTGCAGCPFGRGFEEELEIIKKYEPKLYAACEYCFGKSYEYTRKYREFREQLEGKRG